MITRVDSTSLIPGKVICGNRGLGELGSTIRLSTATGDNGPGLIYPSLVGLTDDNDSFRFYITSAPASGKLFVEETGAFTLLNPANGKWYLTGDLYKNGISLGSLTFPMEVGLQRLNKTSDVQYGIRSQLNKTQDVSYVIRNQLNKTSSVVYSIRNRLNVLSTLEYAIEAGNGRLEKQFTLQYSIRANLQKTQELSWQVKDASLQRLSKTANLIYSIIGAMPSNYVTIVLKENTEVTIVLTR